jgi:ceramide glucosyltransferase
MSAAFIALFLVLLGLHLSTMLLATLRHLGRAPVPRAGAQTVTLLRPVRGLDPFDLETLESSFGLDWPDYEIIFCAADADDPVCAAIRGMIARHPGIHAQLLVGEDIVTRNPKLNNLVKGWDAARGTFVVMADANLLLPPDYLHRAFAVWDQGCELVTSPPAGTRPGNLWGAVECAFLNGFQGRWQLAADSVGLGFAQGKTLMVRKAWLDQQGGLPALGRNMAEDVAFTRLVRGTGAHVRLTTRMYEQPVGARSAQAVWARQLRWSRVRRDGFAGLFALECLQGSVPPALLVWALFGAGWVIPLLGAWYLAEWALNRCAGWPHGLRDVAAMILRDLMLPALWVATFARRGFDWRGNTMDVVHGPT